ncbi:phosphoribosylglycinamide formyltransferase [Psychrobacillus psychrodurans]|uniref:phosphoribosylglycinamide formyltransferase n=1 Tax=Psychrobacillus psychrodurans TaxID=126157 RepID=UPI0008E43578|nr:phosphoribosylglycinamide formyltransferase [Psychrobacillus psychrodurans]MCK1997464.1 phosphoribosylglycinamide formyltransferase [Psychrobacillus psychrodurans]MCZ8540445.1 phosphoribosylglycinamide formyltransferase [Psychrobacillus psychrodurans]SFM70228.1 phosphoribosylglycinamide formyltransferase-1 [Psychrobacillus psychrodurans]
MTEVVTKFAVFASGSGTNFQAIYDAVQDGKLTGEAVLVVTDKPDAFIVERAEKAGIATLAIKPSSFSSKSAYEQAILEKLTELNVEWIVLAGYMRLIGDVLLEAFPNRIINIHPSLLPAFPGKDAIGQAMEHGVKVTGVTVHYVDAGMDTGTIIAQQAVEVVEGDRVQTEKRIHEVEHALYTKALQQLFGK